MSSDDKPYSVDTREGYFIHFAELLRPHLEFSRIVVTGGFRSAQGMIDAVSQGATDSMCRLFLYIFYLSSVTMQ